MHFRKTFLASMFGLMLVSNPAWADMHGNFPGKGNIADWHRAISLMALAQKEKEAKNYGRAIMICKQAIAVYPYDARAYCTLGVFYTDNNEFVLAEKAVQKSLALESSSGGWNQLGVVYLNQMRWNDCQNALDRALKTAETARDRQLALSNMDHLRYYRAKGKI